ncbi:hypothetical protein M1D34_24125 [Ensifer sp. D2-11]
MSKTATRAAGSTKSALPSVVVAVTKSMMRAFASPSTHEGRIEEPSASAGRIEEVAAANAAIFKAERRLISNMFYLSGLTLPDMEVLACEWTLASGRRRVERSMEGRSLVRRRPRISFGRFRSSDSWTKGQLAAVQFAA